MRVDPDMAEGHRFIAAMRRQMGEVAGHAADGARHGYDLARRNAETRIRSRPAVALMAAFGIGVLSALMLRFLFRDRDKRRG